MIIVINKNQNDIFHGGFSAKINQRITTYYLSKDAPYLFYIEKVFLFFAGGSYDNGKTTYS
jgi:hypothetical protein